MICFQCHKEIAEYSNFCYYCGARQQAAPPPQPLRPTAPKRLMRSSTDVKIAGVCAGFGEYFDVDPSVVRLVWVLLVILPVPLVPAVLGYIVAWIILPKAPVFVPASAPSATTQAAQSS